MIDFITITPAQGMTVGSFFKLKCTILKRTPFGLPLVHQFGSSNADFCLKCLCIYDRDGGCMCTKYARNSAGDYIAKQEAK